MTTRELQQFRVTLHEDAGDKFTIVFDCMAEDEDHAEEQAINAYPNGKVLNVSRFAEGWL